MASWATLLGFLDVVNVSETGKTQVATTKNFGYLFFVYNLKIIIQSRLFTLLTHNTLVVKTHSGSPVAPQMK